MLNTDTKDTLTAVEMKKSLVEDYFGKGGYVYINSRGNKVESLNYIDNSYISVMSNTDPIFKNYNISVNGKEYTMFKFLKMLLKYFVFNILINLFPLSLLYLLYFIILL